MQTKPKSNSIVTHRLSADRSQIIFNVLGVGERTFTRTKVSGACRESAEINGWVQRIVDAAAIPRDLKTGVSATPEMKAAKMDRVIAHYESGAVDWNLPREGGMGPALDEVAIAAVSEVTSKPISRVREMIAEGAAKTGMKPAAYLAKLAATGRVSDVIKRIRGGGDADAMLDDMLRESGEMPGDPEAPDVGDDGASDEEGVTPDEGNAQAND